MMTWPQEWIDRAAAILRATPRAEYDHALAALSEEVGAKVTADALQKVFKRRGLGPPTSYLAGPMASPPPAAAPSGDCCAPAMACVVKPEAPIEPERQTERVLIIPDAHHPFADARAWALMLKAARGWKPDHIVVLGDLIDFYSVSFHPKDPTRKVNLEREIDAGIQALDEIDALGAARKTITLGNHEHRLQRYLMQHAPAVYDMLKLEEILKLAERGWVSVPYNESVRVGSAHVSHEFGEHGMNAHRTARALIGGDVCLGHTHRMSLEFRGLADGTPTAGAMFGHLIDLSTIDYMHKRRASLWTLGFGTAHILPSGKTVFQCIPIVDYQCVVDGVVYEQAPLPKE